MSFPFALSLLGYDFIGSLVGSRPRFGARAASPAVCGGRAKMILTDEFLISIALLLCDVDNLKEPLPRIVPALRNLRTKGFRRW